MRTDFAESIYSEWCPRTRRSREKKQSFRTNEYEKKKSNKRARERGRKPTSATTRGKNSSEPIVFYTATIVCRFTRSVLRPTILTTRFSHEIRVCGLGVVSHVYPVHARAHTQTLV